MATLNAAFSPDEIGNSYVLDFNFGDAQVIVETFPDGTVTIDTRMSIGTTGNVDRSLTLEEAQAATAVMAHVDRLVADMQREVDDDHADAEFERTHQDA